MENKKQAINNLSTLILSCDKYEDIWYPFFTLYNKYFNIDVKTYISTETKKCDYAIAINKNYPLSKRTARIRESLKEIDSKYVIVMDEDNFISDYVNVEEIKKCIEYMEQNPNIAQFNFEPAFDKKDKKTIYKGWLKRNNKSLYLNSFQPSLHNRKILIERLSEDIDGWDWERKVVDTPYDIYISEKDNRVIKYGKELNAIYGIFRGKWYRPHCEPLFNKENIKVDFTKRGFYEETPNIKLSIIVPYYKTLPLTKKLMKVLIPQITDEVEVILVDDGCFEKELAKFHKIKVIQQENGGVSKARNTGIDQAKGEYIAFIDSDDLVVENYIEKILNKIKEEWDYCYISWKAVGTIDGTFIIKSKPLKWNTCVWNTVYKKSIIGKFNENKSIGEDEEFNLAYRKGKKAYITDVLYIYNSGREGSLTRNNIEKVANQNTIITNTNYVEASLIVHQQDCGYIGGIETFLLQFFKALKDDYDILFVYRHCDPQQLLRYKKYVKCIQFTGQMFKCQKYINCRVIGNIANNVIADEYIQMIHADFKALEWKYIKHPKTTKHIAVSMVAQKSFLELNPNETCDVIYNLLETDKPKRVLNLISATRLSHEKGVERMKKFALELKSKGIPFIWNIYSTDRFNNNIDEIVFRNAIHNDQDYTANADYAVYLPDTESYGYSIVQALKQGTPVIVTDIPVLKELGFKDGVNGFVLPMDMSNMRIDEIYKANLKGFEYKALDDKQQWIDYLGKLNKKGDYKYIPEKVKMIKVLGTKYRDCVLDEVKKKGDEYLVTEDRAKQLIKALPENYIQVLDFE